MGGLLRKAVAPIRRGSLHNNDQSILFTIAQLRKTKEKAVGHGVFAALRERAPAQGGSYRTLGAFAVDRAGTCGDVNKIKARDRAEPSLLPQIPHGRTAVGRHRVSITVSKASLLY